MPSPGRQVPGIDELGTVGGGWVQDRCRTPQPPGVLTPGTPGAELPFSTGTRRRWSLTAPRCACNRGWMIRLPVVTATAAMASGAAVAYGQLLRPRLMRWGASEQEVSGPYPGAERVRGGERAMTMAVSIDAPPEEVWPWLVQLGGDRAGWYSWDRLDNAGVPSAREVRLEWQDRAIGDCLKFRMPGNAMVDAYTVAMLEPNRFLGLYGATDLRGRSLNSNRPRPRAWMEGLWGFQLRELAGDRTRLVIGGYQTMRPRWLERFYNYWVYVPVVWIMQARMLAVLKSNIERAAQSHPGRQALHDTASVPSS